MTEKEIKSVLYQAITFGVDSALDMYYRLSDNHWHTGIPTEVENDIYWKYNYALVLNTEYDCIGNYLAGELFVPDFERAVFATLLGNGKELTIPFEDVVAWQKITPFEGSKENT